MRAHERGGVEPEMRCHQVMRPNERGRRREQGEREEALYTVGAWNGSVVKKMLRGGKRCGAILFSSDTENTDGRCFLDSLEITTIRSGLCPVKSGRSYICLNTLGESGRCPLLELIKTRGQLFSVFSSCVF